MSIQRHKCSSCLNFSEYDADAYFGICPQCWSRLSPDKRAVLGGTEPPQVIERVRTVYPVKPRIVIALAWLWRVVVSGALVWVIWRTRR